MNYSEAIRAMFTLINTPLAAALSTVIYPNTATPVPTNGSVSWARVTVQHAQGRQRSIPAENQHHQNVGVLTIQLFQPTGRGLAGNTLVPTLLSTLRNSPFLGSLFFKDVTSSEQGTSGHWYQTNILATFDYDSIG